MVPEPGTGLLDETLVSVYLNGRHHLDIMTVPDRLPALVVGLLLGGQVIRSRAEIESVLEEEGVVRVLTTDPFRVVVPRRGTLTGCGGAVTRAIERRLAPLPSTPPIPFQEVEEALDRISDPPAGLFSAALETVGGRWFESDDLGLATALARVIGEGVLNGDLPGGGRVAAVSHRATAELVRSAVLASVPVLVSTGPVTGLAVELAERTGLALYSSGGGGVLSCHAHPERLSK